MLESNRTIRSEIAALRNLSTEELRALHLEVFGQEPKIRHRNYFFKRLAFWIQERHRSDEQSVSSTGTQSRTGK